MLNNPNWNIVKQNIFTKESLIGWLEQQDPHTRYVYSDGMACLLCCYFRAMGLNVERVTPTSYSADGVWYSFPAILNAISLKGGGTYGGALAIAKHMENVHWDF